MDRREFYFFLTLDEVDREDDREDDDREIEDREGEERETREEELLLKDRDEEELLEEDTRLGE